MAESKKRSWTAVVWIAAVVLFFLIFQAISSSKPRRTESFEAFRRHVADSEVAEVRVDKYELIVELVSGDRYVTRGVLDGELADQLYEAGVPISAADTNSPWSAVLIYAVPAVVVVLLFFYFLRRARGTTGDIFELRKTRARLIPEESKVTFADVAGCEEAKLMLGDLVDFLTSPQRWAKAGVRLPRGVLLEGPPGCGKTLLARAVAGETNAKFYVISASEFVEMFVGVGAARVRDTFDTARKNAPAVIFIDELDAVGRRRGSGIGSSHDEREQTLNQLLVCLDGFESRDPVVVIAATNRPDILDSALVRPGRFDRRIKVTELSREARLQALRIHTRNKKLALDASLEAIADRTAGYSGAQLESLANEAALLAVRRSRHLADVPPELRMDDFLQAMRPAAEQSRIFNKLDALLIESTTQLAEPTGRAMIRVFLDGAACVEGELLWADAHFLKIRGAAGEIVVPKAQIRRIEATEGTESIVRAEVVPDPWSTRLPGTA